MELLIYIFFDQSIFFYFFQFYVHMCTYLSNSMYVWVHKKDRKGWLIPWNCCYSGYELHRIELRFPRRATSALNHRATSPVPIQGTLCLLAHSTLTSTTNLMRRDSNDCSCFVSWPLSSVISIL